MVMNRVVIITDDHHVNVVNHFDCISYSDYQYSSW